MMGPIFKAVALVGCIALGLLVNAASTLGYGIEGGGAKVSTTAAAEHPDFNVNLTMTPAEGEGSPRLEDAVVELPPGLYGNPTLTPRCSTGEFVGGHCPQDAQVGIIRVAVRNFCHSEVGGIQTRVCTLPVFNLAPVDPENEIARFGFAVAAFPVFLDVSVRTAGDYGVTASVRSAVGAQPVEGAETIFWGDPADHSHDALRMTMQEGIICEDPSACVKEPGGERPSGLEPFAFMTNPSSCGQGSIGL